ncbi:MAG: nitronate monooxygenase, partial [bacterium]|nr:nitronate monooxygenase [bacterium]
PGRALRNRFTERWHGHEQELAGDHGALEEYRGARAERNYDLWQIYAGEAVGMLHRARPAEQVIAELCDGAERLLRERASKLLAQ